MKQIAFTAVQRRELVSLADTIRIDKVARQIAVVMDMSRTEAKEALLNGLGWWQEGDRLYRWAQGREV